MKEVKLSFAQRVLEFINGGEEANVANILKTAIKSWNKQVKAKERVIKDLEEKLKDTLEEKEEYLAEANVALKEAYLNINADVKGRDDIKYYLSEYESQIGDAKYMIGNIVDSIDKIKSATNVAITKLKSEIAEYKENIKAIS